VSPLRGEKPQNRPLSKLNTGSFALRAMLPVITVCAVVWPWSAEIHFVALRATKGASSGTLLFFSPGIFRDITGYLDCRM